MTFGLRATNRAEQYVPGHVPNADVAALINGWQPKDAHFVAKVVDDWVPEGSSEDAAKQLQVAAGQHVFVTDIATPWLMVTDATGATGWVPEDNVEDVKCRDTIGTLYVRQY